MKTLKARIVIVTLPLIAGLAVAAPRATGTVIGTVVSGGAFRLNGDTVISNGTLLDGAVIETARTDSSVRLASGTRFSLSPDSRARLFGDHMVLERGETRIEQGVGFQLEALGLVVRSGARSGGGSSSGRIGLEGNTRLRVAAGTASFRVWNAQGVLVANVAPGSALALEPQPAAAAATQITGTLTEQRGHFLLTDQVTRITVEITGQRLASYVGQVVGVTGVLSAPQIVAASHVQSVDSRASARGASASVVGGVSAVESPANPDDVPQGPPPGRPKGPPPGRPKGPPETPPGLSR